jgi:WD40 repeat protein
VGSGEVAAKLEGHSGRVFHVAFSPNSQRIVTTSADHAARVYGVITLSELAKLLQK